jgi:3-oxoadipate enol-lactonase
VKQQSGFAPVFDTQLYYEISGSGPNIVFLHGNPLDLHMWDKNADVFTEQYSVLRFDFRGFGRSGNPGPEGYSHAEDLKAMLDYLDIKESIIAGLSMGGGAAVNFTILYPEMTRALIAIDSSLGGFKYSREFMDSLSSLPETAREKGVQTARKEMLKLPIFQPAMKHEQISKEITAMLNNYSGWHWLNRDTGKPLNPPAIERLGEINCPALIIVGEYDTRDFHGIADTFAEKIPNAKKVVIERTGHLVNMESPEEFNKIVFNFLKDNN